MSADEIPTTIAALMAEHDRKISSRNVVPGIRARRFFQNKSVVAIYSAAIKFLTRESREVRDLQRFLVIDCNGYMKFFSAHCGRR